jgi:hypothetical protein
MTQSQGPGCLLLATLACALRVVFAAACDFPDMMFRESSSLAPGQNATFRYNVSGAEFMVLRVSGPVGMALAVAGAPRATRTISGQCSYASVYGVRCPDDVCAVVVTVARSADANGTAAFSLAAIVGPLLQNGAVVSAVVRKGHQTYFGLQV